MMYKVKYIGFAYVEAENEQDAREAFDECEEIYDEREVTSIEEVDEFYVTFEEDEEDA